MRSLIIYIFLSSFLVGQLTGNGEESLPREKVIDTSHMLIDKIYNSMQGPYDRVAVDTSDMDWVTSFKSEVIHKDRGIKLSGEYFCHSQLDFPDGQRLLVGATGMEDITFPEGFAMPFKQIIDIRDDKLKALTFLGMALNNHHSKIHLPVTIRSRIQYWRESDLKSPAQFKPLFKKDIVMWVDDLEDCKGVPVEGDVTTHCSLVRDQKVHWYVEPGKQLTRKHFPGQIFQTDVQVHYAAVHLHNFGRYMRLRDLTTGELLLDIVVEYVPGRSQILKIPSYSDTKGFKIFRDHTYEMEAFYDNDSGETVDAMAAFFLYFNPIGDVQPYLDEFAVNPNR